MKKWENFDLDDASMWPKDCKIALQEPNVDDRGSIQSLVNFPVKNISLISSVKGSVRSNHYHLTDWHYMYVLSGSFDYYYRPTDSNEELQKVRFVKGDLVFTPPMEDHATLFIEDTVLIVMSRHPRGTQEVYEADVKRVILIDPKNPPLV
jgi:oxalate decarboxylase/phosphoglucose isomerase-like protein (cupin superfamily)